MKAHDAPDLSVVIPVYDERDNLEPLVQELATSLETLVPAYDVWLVDDGSGDGSGAEIERLAREHAFVRALRLRRHAGQTAAFDAGLRASSGRLIVTLDADLQYDPADIRALLAALDGHDAAVGYRVERRDAWLRRWSSRLANLVRNRLSDERIIDTGCSLKAFRGNCLRSIKLYDGMHRFLPTLLRIEGYSVVEVPVRHRPRKHGRSKYGVTDRAIRAFVDLLAVRWMKRRRLEYEVNRDEP